VTRLLLSVVVVALGWLPSTTGFAQSSATSPEQTTFRAGVEAVAISITIRDSRGRVVPGLSAGDFEVMDSGLRTPITDFFAGEGPVSLAVLIDISGSMAVDGNMARAQETVSLLMASLQPLDEASLYTFDSQLNQVVAFTSDLTHLRRASFSGKPWGSTSLFDSIGTTAQAVAGRTNRHRALVVISDGVDTASRLSASEVSGIAAAIDVPVYLIRVAGSVDRWDDKAATQPSGRAALADLARWTGGDIREVSKPSDTQGSIREVLSELRHQYVVTFEPGTRPGWHPIEVRMRKKNMFAHTRGGYVAGPARSGS
jgi:Ca-activated chloride channel homolog